MAFTPFNNDEIAAGEPVKQELFQKTKDDFDDHESRILTTEGSLNAFQPLQFDIYGAYSDAGTLDDAVFTRITFDLTVQAIRLLIHMAGTSGTTEIDLLYKRGAGAWTSLLLTRPSVAFGAGDFALSTNAVLDTGETLLLAGDLLKLELTASQVAGIGLTGFLEYEKT